LNPTFDIGKSCQIQARLLIVQQVFLSLTINIVSIDSGLPSSISVLTLNIYLLREGSNDKSLFQISHLKPSAECFYSLGGFLFDARELVGAKTSQRQRGGF
jgi:hypothetical protein